MRSHLRSERVKLPRVHRLMKSGKLYKWHRVTRKPLPADVPEDDPTFIAAWTAEEAAKPSPRTRGAPGSISAAWVALKRTTHFGNFSAGYRAQIVRHGDAICAAYGDAPVAGLRKRHIEHDLSQLAPHAATKRLKTWRLICAHANSDATVGLSKPKAPKAVSHAPWEADEIAAYRRRWPIGSAARLAFEMLYWTAARTSDAVRLGPSFVGSDGLLTYRQQKTKNPAHVPWSSALPDWAAEWAADRDLLHQSLPPGGVFTFLEVAGRQRSCKGLSNRITRSAETAGIYGKTAHGLRATRLTLIAEAGGSTQAIMSWGGSINPSAAELYTKKADRRRVLLGTERKQNPVNLPEKAVNS